MGGDIGFESTRGVGSTFWFRIPRVPALGPGSSSWTPAPDAAATARRLDRQSRRILVVDDRAANRSVAVALLGEIGYAAEAVESGEEALSLLARRAFDAVLLDSEMPGLDGPETCRRLRAQEGDGRRLPVIAVSAHTRPEEREACLAAGMDDYMTKPFQVSDLAVLLDRWTGISSAAPPPSSSGFQEERLAELKALGGDHLARIVRAFLEQGESDLATLRLAVAQGDGESLAKAAHGLAGSAGVLGAEDLAASAAELAALGRQGDLAGSAAGLARVETGFREAARRLSA
jgi:CheY-like chemotaxis protein